MRLAFVVGIITNVINSITILCRNGAETILFESSNNTNSGIGSINSVVTTNITTTLQVIIIICINNTIHHTHVSILYRRGNTNTDVDSSERIHRRHALIVCDMNNINTNVDSINTSRSRWERMLYCPPDPWHGTVVAIKPSLYISGLCT